MKLLNVQVQTWEKARRIADELKRVSGRKWSLAQTVDRALDCLDDANHAAAWLSPREARPVMQERLESLLAHVVHQALLQAGHRVKHITSDNGVITVKLEQGDDIVLVGVTPMREINVSGN